MNNITLYSLDPLDRSARVRWLYEELGIDFQQIWMDPKSSEHMGDAYRRVNPFATVPGVERDGVGYFESGAIILDTLERMPGQKLAPAPGDPNRSEFLKWFMWGYQTFEHAVLSWFRNHEKPLEDPMRQGAVFQMERMLNPIDQHLQTRAYVIGDFSAADIVIGWDLALAQFCKFPFAPFVNVEAYTRRLAARPAAKSFYEAVAKQ